MRRASAGTADQTTSALARRALLRALLVPLALSRRAGAAPNQVPALRNTRLYVVANSTMLYGVNPSDARAALRVWFESVARRKGFLLDCRVDILDNLAEIKARLRAGQVDVLLPNVPVYLELERSNLAKVTLVHSVTVQAGPRYPYVLLVSGTSMAKSLAGLRGRSVYVNSRGGSGTGHVWLEVMLGQEGLGRAASFFSSVKEIDKPQGCILPLFFNSVDACVVDEVNLNLAKELNPQLARLRVLARSEPLVENFIATPLQPHPYQTELMDAILTLHEDVAHRQLLMVFRTQRVTRVQQGDLDPIRELWREYRRLAGPPGGGVPGSVRGGN